MKMKDNIRYVCEMSGVSEEFDAVAAKLKANMTQSVEALERAFALKKEAQVLWRPLWDAAVKAGKISPDLDYDDYNMHLPEDQLFISPESKDEKSPKIDQLLKGLIK